MSSPRAVVVFSGKRKSGKDYISDVLLSRLGEDKCCIMRLSAPLKEQYAKENNLDFDRLLDASEYKEKFRADMILWGEEKRRRDPGFFCRHATSGKGSEKDVWIISDARRLSDVCHFEKNFPDKTVTVRVHADLPVREARGFVFTAGVDDAESECGLDSGVDWSVVVTNNGDEQRLEEGISQLIGLVNSKLH